jgi:hypothetical protein
MKNVRTLSVIGVVLLSIPSIAPAQARDFHGAIAFGIDNGAYGVSSDFGSRAGAEHAALRLCRSYGGQGCKIVVWFKNACGGLAISQRNGFGAGWAESAEEAREMALDGCYRYNPTCQGEKVVCTAR